MVLPDWLLPLLASPFVGSLVGVLIRRLPAGRPVALARSACEACGRVLRPAELVPLVSFLALRGRCRGCGAPIARFYPAVELAALAVALSAVLAGARGVALWAGCGLGWTLLALGWIDWTFLVLPDALTLPLIVAGVGVAARDGAQAAFSSALGAALGFLGFWAVALLYRRLRGREGLGMGDAKLLAVAGAWLGGGALAWVVLYAALAGIALALLARAGGRRLEGALAVPFGPPLAAAIWLVWLFPGSAGGG